MRKVLYLLIIPVILAGCAKVKEVEITQEQEGLHEVVFHAGWDQETRTVLQEDGSVWWSPGDNIILFVDNNQMGYQLQSTNKSAAPKADFKGRISDGTLYSAIYPFGYRNYYDGEVFHLDFFNCEQEAQEGTFEKDSFISIAQTTDNTLFFKNVCGGIKFSVVNEGITHIRFHSDESPIGGYLLYQLNNDGIPVYSGCEGGEQSDRIVYAPDHGTFEPNKDYYIVFPAMTIPGGLTIRVYKGDYYEERSFSYPIEIHRSVFKRLNGLDKGMQFPQNHNENAAKLYEFLPEDIHKETITEVKFHVNDNTTTDKLLSASTPVYYDIDGTTVNLYTTEDYYDISAVTNSMFYFYTALKNLDLSKTLVNTATSFSEMFRGCLSLESIQFGNWDTFYVTNISFMFSGCRQLRCLDLSFMDTHNVDGMRSVFGECWSLSSLDLSSFNTSKVTVMAGMFYSCTGLSSLNIESFDTSNVTRMEGMFENCSQLKSIDLSHFDTHQVTNMSSMFSWCESLKGLNLSSFNTSSVISFENMFNACLRLESLDLSNFQTSKCQSMCFMFGWCTSLKHLDISSFTSESLENASIMFTECERLQKLDMGAFDISQANYQDICSGMMRVSKAGGIRCLPETKVIMEQALAPVLEGKVKWMTLSEDINTYEYPKNPDLYYSSDFSKHETVKKLYSATKGDGINIVIMGDAYSDRMINSGQYDADMKLAADAVFEKEPFSSFKEYFNVYIVYLVSDNEVLGESTALCGVSSGSGILNGFVSANMLSSYVIQATGNADLSRSTEIVVVRGSEGVTGYASYLSFGVDGDANNTSFYDCDYGHGYGSICVARGNPAETEEFIVTIGHEMGHAFSMLQDEYVTTTESISDTYIITEMYNRFGWAQNVDITSDPSTIRWSCFLSDAEDGVGIYEGGATYSTGVWRPSENSIMNLGTEFNAPSRAAIYRKIHKLAYGRDWQFDYETFVQWDLKNIGLEKRTNQAQVNAYHPHLKHQPFIKVEKKKTKEGRTEINVIMN